MFWLQLWMLEKFSEPCVSQNDSAKEVEKMPKVAPLCCHDCNVSDSCAVHNVLCAVTFLVSTKVGDIGLLPVLLARDLE